MFHKDLKSLSKGALVAVSLNAGGFGSLFTSLSVVLSFAAVLDMILWHEGLAGMLILSSLPCSFLSSALLRLSEDADDLLFPDSAHPEFAGKTR